MSFRISSVVIALLLSAGCESKQAGKTGPVDKSEVVHGSLEVKGRRGEIEAPESGAQAGDDSTVEKSSEEKMTDPVLQLEEEKRQELFRVPVSPDTMKEMETAWTDLAKTDSFSDDQLKRQYMLASDLLERHRDSPMLEKLVFWRLVDLRVYQQSAGGRPLMVLDEELRNMMRSFRQKMTMFLYAALDKDPEKLADHQARNLGRQIIEDAAK